MIVTKVILHTVPRDCLLRDIIRVLLCRLSYLYRQTFLQTHELFARHGLNLGVQSFQLQDWQDCGLLSGVSLTLNAKKRGRSKQHINFSYISVIHPSLDSPLLI